MLTNLVINRKKSIQDNIYNSFTKAVPEKHLKEDARRFKKIDKKADEINDEIDELEKDDKKEKRKPILKKGFDLNLSKAFGRKDYGKLQKKTITNKAGKKQTVYTKVDVKKIKERNKRNEAWKDFTDNSNHSARIKNIKNRKKQTVYASLDQIGKFGKKKKKGEKSPDEWNKHWVDKAHPKKQK